MPASIDADLIVMIKNPILGRVKTRLAKDIGDTQALAIYKVLLERTLSLARAWQGRSHIFFTDFIDTSLVGDDQIFNYLQTEGDLGDRLIAASMRVFDQYPDVPQLIIGSDCYDLTLDHLEQAFQILSDNDFVLGPSEDGGYYLIGMRAFSPFIFQGISWSTSTVAAESIAIMETFQKSYQKLSPLLDIDDLNALQASASLKGWKEQDQG
jgi:rSAM/selenodomain-associated transferase 1